MTPWTILQDFGKGWTNLTANSNGAIAAFWDFDWGANIHRTEKRSFPDETILATVYERADQMKGLTPGWDKDMHFVHSTDFFKSAHTRLVACGNQFELVGHKVDVGHPLSDSKGASKTELSLEGLEPLFQNAVSMRRSEGERGAGQCAGFPGAANNLSHRP